MIVVDATTTSLVPRLLADELDLAVVNLPVTHPEVLTEPLFDEDRILIAPRGHPLADAGTRVSLAELADHELLLEPSGTAFRDELDREASAAGIELRAKAEVDGLRLIATLAFEGFGAAIVPATAAPAWLDRRLEPGADRRAWNGARSGWRGASGGSSPPRRAPSTTPSPPSWPPMARASPACTEPTT